MVIIRYDIECYQRIENALQKRLDVYDDLKEDEWTSLHEQVSEARRYISIDSVVKCDIFSSSSSFREAESELKDQAPGGRRGGRGGRGGGGGRGGKTFKQGSKRR